MRKILEWLWGFLPDRCQAVGCSRRGVRGNENIIGGVRVCDYCHAKLFRENAMIWIVAVVMVLLIGLSLYFNARSQ